MPIVWYGKVHNSVQSTQSEYRVEKGYIEDAMEPSDKATEE